MHSPWPVFSLLHIVRCICLLIMLASWLRACVCSDLFIHWSNESRQSLRKNEFPAKTKSRILSNQQLINGKSLLCWWCLSSRSFQWMILLGIVIFSYVITHFNGRPYARCRMEIIIRKSAIVCVRVRHNDCLMSFPPLLSIFIKSFSRENVSNNNENSNASTYGVRLPEMGDDMPQCLMPTALLPSPRGQTKMENLSTRFRFGSTYMWMRTIPVFEFNFIWKSFFSQLSQLLRLAAAGPRHSYRSYRCN